MPKYILFTCALNGYLGSGACADGMGREDELFAQAGRGVHAFKSEKEYGAFLHARLQPGSRLIAVSGGYEGEQGAFIRFTSSWEEIEVKWDKYASFCNVWLRDIELQVQQQPSQFPRVCQLLSGRTPAASSRAVVVACFVGYSLSHLLG